jgi:hypothetical protein
MGIFEGKLSTFLSAPMNHAYQDFFSETLAKQQKYNQL